MPLQFHKHYTRDEARSLLPLLRDWLRRLNELRAELERLEKRVQGLMSPGCDLGGSVVNNWIRALIELREVLLEFQKREIQIKDVERGLVDFPCLMNGREVFLCWELAEEDIEFWHELDAGYTGREPL